MGLVDASRVQLPTETLEGPAFPLAVKLVATASVVAVAWYGVASARALAGGLSRDAMLLIALAAATVGVLYYWILVSRTRLEPTHLRQSWLWPKAVPLADIVRVKIVYVPGLAWLIAPRLLVNARGRAGRMVFHMADRRMLVAFVRSGLGG